MNDEQGNEWMDECDVNESVSCLVLFTRHSSLQGNWLRAKADDGIGGKKKSTWSRMKRGGCTCGWNTIGKSGKEGQQESNKRFEGHACFAWKQVQMWENNGK